ncbi:alpha/beta fold hydrolase [Mucilaginibacter sp. McL0603]|uniref:alpha/beta fold hydrolase n=1 Tax=Mucilaginibacter sp. McL0603 TaxID=3415670 RepID=UPI003CF72FCD
MKASILSAICILSVLQFSCNSKSNKSTTADKPIKISNEGVNIVYSDSGNGDTTLLFVHGWGINRSYWSNQVNYFSKKYRVVTIDLPGFGQSGKNRNIWNTEAYGLDLDTVISQLHLKMSSLSVTLWQVILFCRRLLMLQMMLSDWWE